MDDRPCVCGQWISNNDFAMECFYCLRWFHGTCLQISEQTALEIVKFACTDCENQGFHTQHQVHALQPHDVPVAPLHPSLIPKKNSDAFRRWLQSATFASSSIHHLPAHAFDASFFDFHAFPHPILIHQLHKWHQIIQVEDVDDLLTSGLRVASVEIETQVQSAVTNWSEYVTTLGNAPLCVMISLTNWIHEEITAPAAIATIDWHCQLTSGRPNPTLQCVLMGPHAFLDFSIAPHGQSCWISMAQGSALVYLMEPTASHLQAFVTWKSSRSWFPSDADTCCRCELFTGDCLCVPAGWIYAIYADDGASMYGGFFSHTLAIERQLQVLELETNGSLSVGSSTAQVDVIQQLWGVLCLYVNQLCASMPRLHQQMLRQALPALHQWSSTAISTWISHPSAYWQPQSTQEAQQVLLQLAHVLQTSCSPLHLPVSPTMPDFETVWNNSLWFVPLLPPAPSELLLLQRHRTSCHRCGNLRKHITRCINCPHIFCQKCAEKMIHEHGTLVFVDGCPVCKELCCCGKNRTPLCMKTVGN